VTSSTQISNVVGAITAVLINILLIGLFIARLNHKPRVEHWLGIATILTVFPLCYLFIAAVRAGRPLLYFLQIGLMILFLFVELMVDYILKIEFRQVPRLVIPYVMLFFAGTGGMIGVAGQAGKGWTIGAVLSFLVMAILSFVQRHLTGL